MFKAILASVRPQPSGGRRMHTVVISERRSKRLIGQACLAMFSANLVGLAGLLAISVWLLQVTGSYILSSCIFACQWVLPLLCPNGIARVTKIATPRMVASGSDWASALFSFAAACLLRGDLIPIAFLFVIVRGFCDSVTRSAASLMIKLNESQPDRVEKGIGSLEFYRLMGTSASGTMFAFMGAHITPPCLLYVTGAAYAITGTLYRLAPGALAVDIGDRRKTRGRQRVKLVSILKRQPLAISWLWSLCATTGLQGLHNSIRIAYPQEVLRQGIDGVGAVSTVATIGLVCGSWIATKRMCRRVLDNIPTWCMLPVSGCLGLAAVAIHLPAVSYLFYFAFMTFFEVSFMYLNIRYSSTIHATDAATMFGLRGTALNASVLSSLLFSSWVLTFLSVLWTTVFTICALSAFSVVPALVAARAKKWKDCNG